MDDTACVPASPARKWWLRALFMILMAVAFQLAGWLLVGVAVLQLVLFAATGRWNERLRDFGAALGRYLAQIAGFVSFGTEEVPFPFSDWPAAA